MPPENTSNQSGLDNSEQIANLLIEEDKLEDVNEDETEDAELDSEEEETPPEESTEEESESESDEDTTWEKVLGVEEGQLTYDDEGNITGINVKVDGESSTVKVKDLIAGYQINKSLTQRSQAFAEERKIFESQAKLVAEDYKAKLENVDVITNYLSKKLVSEFEGIDWNRLRVENPAEYAAARHDYATRASELQEAQAAILDEKRMMEEKHGQQSIQARQAFLQSQRNVMLEKNPSWANPEVFQKDMDGIKSFLSNQYGFTNDDFATVVDARLIELVKDAKKFRDGVKVAEKKVAKPVPKFQKSVGKKAKSVSKLDKLTKAAKSASGANKRVAQADAIAELLTGGI